ncbi:Thymidylate kinase [Triticum urartu]|uniref:dTMP kinase n=1 Tax=Triticum urartu TaxID=4572 RepID=M7YP34_TRIUA|nr:Thymidylate kinase [Triticum urartu]
MDNGGGKGGRGALIVLEGLDRSGKSSQCARLLSFLEGKGCATEGWRFPDRDTSVGKMISAYLSNESQLDDRTIHLLFSANRWEKRSLMESKLLGGTTLIVDRYSYSGVAFSAAKGLDIGWCKAPEVGLLAPDLVIYLDVQPEQKVPFSAVDYSGNPNFIKVNLKFLFQKAAERGGYGGERYERVEFQKRVAEHYYSLRDSTWKVVDGSLPMETVEEQLRELAMNCISECQDKQLTNLPW